MNKLRVLLADDHAIVREGLKSLINSQSDMEVVGEAADGQSAITMTTDLNPDVLVVDISMPELSGTEVTKRLCADRPDQKILVLTVHEEKSYVRAILEAGASGYVLKRAAAAELVQAIRTITEGRTHLDPTLIGRMVDSLVHPVPECDGNTVALSDRESEVMRLIARGYSNKEIAGQLKVSVKTIETYKTRSMEKLKIRSRVEIVRYAVKCGWLENA